MLPGLLIDRYDGLGRDVVSSVTGVVCRGGENPSFEPETLCYKGIRDDGWAVGTVRVRHRDSRRVAVVGPVALVAVVQAVAVAVVLLAGGPAAAALLAAIAVGVVGAFVAHRTVGSLVAGAGLKVVRPYAPGEQVRVFVPSLESVQEAEVVRVGPANTTLLTRRGLVTVPNAQMLRGPDPRDRRSSCATSSRR